MNVQHQPRLIIVSNRVPVDADRPGGLAVALQDALASRKTLWFGWSGEIAETGEPGELEVETSERDGTEYAVAPLTRAEHDGYYAGYANEALWPTLHYRLDLARFSNPDFETYMAVNARFADQLMTHIRPGDQIWVHDYHLMPLAAELRERGAKNPIGFFSHIPFPSPEIFRAIPQHESLIRGLTACDLVGFQSERDRANFDRHRAELGNGIWRKDGSLDPSARLARSKAFPIGMDAAGFRRDADEAAKTQPPKRDDEKMILGVDRMDYSKGLIERVQAFERLIEHRPERAGTATLVQVTPPSREDVQAYADLRVELDTMVGHINSQHSTIDWTPIHFLAQGLPREELAGLFRRAHVGLVTPLRDGMNLVAKEYVAAQDPEDPGVLVLSEFAGAAEQLPEALIVNPHDVRGMADAIETALTMPLDERKDRHAAMMRTLLKRDAAWWSDAFLRELGRCEGTNPGAAPVPTRAAERRDLRPAAAPVMAATPAE